MTHWHASAPLERHGLTEAERLAIAETELRHLSHAVTNVTAAVTDVAASVKKIENTLATASGVKLALIIFGATLSFIVTQIWHYLDFRGLK